jgi:amino acid permease
MLDLKKLVDVGRWFTPFPEPPSRLYLVVVAFFVVWTIISIYLYAFRGRVFARDGVLKGMATRFGWYAIWIGIVGLFFLAMRYAQIPYFDIRAFLYLTILVAVGFVGFLSYYLRARYPRRVAELRELELRRKYAPDPRRKRRARPGG